MKNILKNNLILSSMSSVFLLLSNADGVESYENLNDFNKAEINYKTIKLFLESNVDSYKKLMDSSIDKDIVVVLGNTGAGKSTLINYLSGKRLKCIGYQKIELMNPYDESAMEIGNGGRSQTLLPKSVLIANQNLLFYDLPGFHDNRGALANLLNASFIKNILERARTTRFVFVVGLDEITAQRGASIKDLWEISKKLIPGQSLEGMSSLVVTKSDADDIEELWKILEQKCPEATEPWGIKSPMYHFTLPMVGHMYMPKKGEVLVDKDKTPLFNLIKRTRPIKINTVDTSVIYSFKDQTNLQELFKQEINEIAKIIIQMRAHYDIDSLKSLKAEKSFYEKNFLQKVLWHFETRSNLTYLLKPIAQGPYQDSRDNLGEIIQPRVDKQIYLISEHIRKIEKLEYERKIKEEQERQRKIEEERREKEEEKRRYEERRRRIYDDYSSSSSSSSSSDDDKYSSSSTRREQRVKWTIIPGVWTVTESRERGGEWGIDWGKK